MSRRARPKQLLPLIDGRSLLEIAVKRLDGLVDPSRRLVCTAEAHRAAVRQAVPDLADDQILGEPEGRDTVNAVGLAAAVLANHDPDAVFAVLTADHLIEPHAAFARGLELGFSLAESDPSRFVTFSITPTHPATGYGYVERSAPIGGFDGAYEAAQFVEKPDRATAETYLRAGTFGWNSGMFVFHAATFLDRLRVHVPGSYDGLMRIAEAWGTADQQAVLEREYANLTKTSVDFGVMEPASNDPNTRVCVVPLDITWMDVGSWPSFGETLDADDAGNRTNARVMHTDSSNVLAVSDDPQHMIATIGCEDLIIVRTADVTLVCRADQAERVKDLALRADPSLQ